MASTGIASGDAAYRPSRPGRDADASRHALLQAARTHFARDGFGGTSIRDIAADAGVDQALVYRYYGSKAALYERVISSYAEELGDLLRSSEEDLATEVVAYLFDKSPQAGIEPVIALLRGGPAADPLLGLLQDFVDRLAERATGGPEEARLRAGLIGALTVGVVVMRDALGDDTLRSAEPEHVAPLFAEAVKALLRTGHEDR